MIQNKSFRPILFFKQLIGGALILLSVNASFASENGSYDKSQAMNEGISILNAAAHEAGRPSYSPETAVRFKNSYNVFMKSALAIDFTYRSAWVQLPLYRGLSPSGKSVYYILTEVSDYDVARRMGINYSPKMDIVAAGAGSQAVTLTNGIAQFKGNVDFSPEHLVVPGDQRPFPPKVAKAGAVADSEWSSFIVLPSGVVFNAQIIANDSGQHVRVKKIDLKNRTVNLAMLDGYQGGKQYFYHLVTDVSAELPAALENGVYAPKLALIPTIGKSFRWDQSANLGFSPVLNGITTKDSGQEQGFEASIANGGIDPINVFPFGPNNRLSSRWNNYSPMWDAHVSMWTDEAKTAGKVRRITGFKDLKRLIKAGWVTSSAINPPGPGNPFVFGLRPTQALINCPVIAHPVLPEQ